ncbi:ABC transporter permease subunit [Humidisolicoccus flavus]
MRTSKALMPETRIGPFVFKIILLAIFDALAVMLLMILLSQGDIALFVVVLIAAILINVVYLVKGLLPAKYLTPGIVFLLIFQVFTIGYTGYIATTNYSSGHILTKDDAVQALLSQNQQRVENSSAYPLVVVEQLGGLGFLVLDEDGDALLGTTTSPLEPVDADFDGDTLLGVPGWTTLNFSDVLQRQSEIFALTVPVSDDPNDGSLRTLDGSTAYLYLSTLTYDETAGTVTNAETGAVYTDAGNGAFETADGEQILPGWRINIGAENFITAFTEEGIRDPLIKVTIWTFAFAFLSVATTFALGLFLAIVFNSPKMRGRKIYRTIMILPYAFPAFLAALVWAGMYSTSFGFFNQVLLGGAAIPWLTDPLLAKIAVLLLNLWLGFPYMFLVCMGALQSIPDELTEAATSDGARPWQVFRLIKFPLLLVSVAPLLISSFAFNFNNFNLIYMLTGGGPRDFDASIPVGETDILISMVYKVAFTGQDRDYGLASAFSIIIFVLVATISIISFRRTRALEELNA